MEREAASLIPVPEPYGGCLIIGAESIVYHNGLYYRAIAPPTMQQSTIYGYCKIDKDGSRYLLGDMAGHLYMLLLIKEDSASKMGSSSSSSSSAQAAAAPMIKDLKLELLGKTVVLLCKIRSVCNPNLVVVAKLSPISLKLAYRLFSICTGNSYVDNFLTCNFSRGNNNC